MSHVTNIILTTMVDEEDAVKELNGKLSVTAVCSSPRPVDLSRCPNTCGGNKYLECDIYLAAYNYFKLDNFLGAVRSVAWEYPEDVQLFVKDQHDSHFTEVVVFPDT